MSKSVSINSKPNSMQNEVSGEPRQKKRSPIASPSIFGWQFQVTAAIAMMLAAIEENRSIKVEGFKQDIEITKKKGEKVYVQAKSMKKPSCPMGENKIGPYNSAAHKHLKNAINSLKGTYDNLTPEEKKKCRRLEYATNIDYPFGKVEGHDWRRVSRYEFGELSDFEVDSFQRRCKGVDEEFSSMLSFYYMSFPDVKDWETQHLEVLDIIRSFLLKLQINSEFCRDYLRTMQALCYYNATQELLQKENSDFVWPAVVLHLDFNESYFDYVLDDIDVDADDLLTHYKTIFDSASNEMEMGFRILRAYDEFEIAGVSTKARKIAFAKHYAPILAREALMSVPEEVREALGRCIAYRVLKSNSLFNRAKQLLD